MGNLDLAQKVLNTLKKINVETICLCAGARNSPFVELLSKNTDFETLSFFDERSAGFFALGRIKSQSKPVAVITTSGTAAGELMPAMMEAYYSALPLIAVTADRPKHYRGTGAPQSAEQVGLYGQYAFKCYDIDENFNSEITYSSALPQHFNICFDEPLPGSFNKTNLEAYSFKNMNHIAVSATQVEKLQTFFNTYQNIFAVIGGLTFAESIAVEKFLKKSQIPFYAEAQSHLREKNNFNDQKFYDITKLFKRAESGKFKIDAILRIGDVPTHRVWRDLEKINPVTVLSISSKPFSGLPNGDLIHTRLESFISEANVKTTNKQNYSKFKEEDAERKIKTTQLLNKYPWSEPGLFLQISNHAQKGTRVYLGNSLPIRQWDLAATYEYKNLIAEATRGLNGIDGQISYFLGGIKREQNSWAIVGDLTALYDVQGLWAVEKLKNSEFKIFIINNNGGKIFERIFGKKEYYNSHQLEFKNLAAMWNLSYQKLSTGEFKLDSSKIVEICPDEESTKKFWEEYQLL